MFYQKELSQDHLRKYAPSIFADAASAKTSSKYLFIPTSKIVDAMIRADFIPVACKQTRSKDAEHAKHVVHFSHRSIQDKLESKQELPLIRIQNSHDAKSSFQIDTGFFRLVCSNGLVMPGTMLNSARITHKVGMEQDVIEASYRVLDSFAAQTAQVDAMKLIELSPEEQALFAQSAVNLVFDAEQVKANTDKGHPLVNTLLAARRQADKSSDLWTIFNRIQENAIKGGRRVFTAKGEVRKMREVNSIDREKQINVELMALAQKMAELKSIIAA